MKGSGPGLFEAVIESWRLVIGNARALARLAKTCSSPLSRFPSFSLLLSTERV